MNHTRVFDREHYPPLNRARGASVQRALAELQPALELRTAVDLGCGLGYFSSLLRSLGLQVSAVDGRRENVEEAQRRFPDIPFCVGDIEDPAILGMGRYDLVFCFGLLYHLENPMLAIRHLRAMTSKLLLVEGMCVPGAEPVLALRDEGPTEDQGLRHFAFYPTEACLVKMLYRAGFSFVYRLAPMPDHSRYRDSLHAKRSRTLLAASHSPLTSVHLVFAPEPCTPPDPWTTRWAKAAGLGRRLRDFALRPRLGKMGEVAKGARTILMESHLRAGLSNPPQGLKRVAHFLRKPWPEKRQSMAFRWIERLPSLPLPVRLPWGSWWLAQNNLCGRAVLNGGFETTETRFVEGFVQREMTVLDIGAHHGYYTLLMSHRVGPHGRVIAFEPSPRERKFLQRHLRLNRCKNVSVETCALASYEGEAELFVVEGVEMGCNSLRRPNVNAATTNIRVPVRSLGECLQRLGVQQVNFIKMDVEGAELEVLQGASQLLQGESRPVILSEVQEIRTQPWGYHAREIIDLLKQHDYEWFQPQPDGSLKPVPAGQAEFDGNFIAFPAERSRHAPNQGLSTAEAGLGVETGQGATGK